MHDVNQFEKRIRSAERKSTLAVSSCLAILGTVFLVGASGSNQDGGRLGLVDKVNVGTVQLGMMVPYFGDKLPEGYVWADGQSLWPDADWVPEHLRGNVAVPNMDAHMLAGNSDVRTVGLENHEGQLEVKNVTVDGKNFTMPASSEFRIATGDGGRRKDGGYVVILNHNSNYDGEVYWQGYGANGDNGFVWGVIPRPAIYQSFARGTALEGSATVSIEPIKLDQTNGFPRHVTCRWIIRIR